MATSHGPTPPATVAGLSAVQQLAYIVPDMDAALEFWTKRMGVGPFFLTDKASFAHVVYQGETIVVDAQIAIAYWGDVQVELIHQRCDTPSVYRDYGGPSVHHYCFFIDDMAEVRRRLDDAGMTIVQTIALADGVSEVIYADSGDAMGTILEYAALAPPYLAAFQRMKDASVGWDGSDPVR